MDAEAAAIGSNSFRFVASFFVTTRGFGATIVDGRIDIAPILMRCCSSSDGR